MTTPNPQDPYQGHPVDPAMQQPQAQPQYDYGQTATPQGYAQPAPQQVVAAKNHVVASVLAFFLGHLGIVDFYMGYTKTGLIKLCGGILGYVLMFIGGVGLGVATDPSVNNEAAAGGMSIVAILGIILLMIISVWVIVTFFQVLLRKGKYKVDAKGIPMV